jgi:hypothetical protein
LKDFVHHFLRNPLPELVSGPTMEIVMVEGPAALYKKLDPEFEAALIDPEAHGGN